MFRVNRACASLIFTHKSDVSLSTLLEKIRSFLGVESVTSLTSPSSSESTVVSEALCTSASSCATCQIKDHKKVPWKRKLIEFGLLSGFALYLFVKEYVFGVAVTASPLSLISGVALVAAIPLLKGSYRDIKKKERLRFIRLWEVRF